MVKDAAMIDTAAANGATAVAMPGVCRDCLAWLAAATGGACPRCASRRLVRHPELAHLAIAHVDCDAFYAAIEKRDNPTLRDKPVIVGHPGGRGVVTTACYVARRFGPRSAMPMFKALALCPAAVVIPPDMAKYRAASRAIGTILARVTPVVEPVSLDEAYLDLASAVRLSPAPPARLLAWIARRIEQDVGITISVGLAANKFLAKLASDLDKPRGFRVIGGTEAPSLLAAQPVGRILGVGPATAARLAAIGIETIGDLGMVPEADLVRRFGRFGRRLAQFARGIDDRPVTPVRTVRSLSAETTFATDLTAPDALARALRPLCERVAARAAQAGVAGGRVVLKLKAADFQVRTRHLRLAHPTQQAERIFQAGACLLGREATGAAFRLIGIGLAELSPQRDADPPELFQADPRPAAED
jgi:DNA polymerase-4